MSRNHNSHSKSDRLPDVEVSYIREPKPVCALCGETISTIVDAISEPDGKYSHFDCVIRKIRETYAVGEQETVSYIGHGSFAVFTKDEDGKYAIREKINYESQEAFTSMKKYVDENRS